MAGVPKRRPITRIFRYKKKESEAQIGKREEQEGWGQVDIIIRERGSPTLSATDGRDYTDGSTLRFLRCLGKACDLHGP